MVPVLHGLAPHVHPLAQLIPRLPGNLFISLWLLSRQPSKHSQQEPGSHCGFLLRHMCPSQSLSDFTSQKHLSPKPFSASPWPLP